MKQKLFIITVFILAAAILVGLNAASYTQKQQAPESEAAPNRSSYNPGPTGTQAFYTLLTETGRKVIRWQTPADDLVARKVDAPTTFVIIGPRRRDFADQEVTGLLRWVAEGGRLVMIDREPVERLVTTTAKWKVAVVPQNLIAILDTDPSDQAKMTASTAAAKPVQPSRLTLGVNAVQFSQFASAIELEAISTSATPSEKIKTQSPTFSPKPPFEQDPKDVASEEDTDEPSSAGPVVQLISGGSNVLTEMPYGAGKIVILADPYIVANGGIGIADNAKLAVNIAESGGGLIAIDEYHHGFGSNNNRLLEFFAGTPIVAIFFQCLVLVGAIFYSRSRRFGRPVPYAEPDRLSKLEYVGAMAELQRRTRALDLAIENIYSDFRRRSVRLLGMDLYSATHGDLAAAIAERSSIDRTEIEKLLFKCEEISAGKPTNNNEVLDCVRSIRKLEYKLGLRKEPVEK
ncbi:MAG TPA: DUF4350 domain-containing protein [Pyrinomonadaceae bacterium]|nr:DUF4350 domain-containing protein [Chloracidobacterium sp.]MBP9935111.1 DUF4350 domain-containing protein [Pyrinomonadaceae bacterium]MBK7803462.1 DUF4350 domain-containing protein [Chloracidobacterium sp.]MBK9438712.1 DUF4350 domain-containing protein [Chloracidobacterium sp.]MBL0241238.1 DUF4350 domain-containing protein [Chloracidobacterium sp.]